jgi:hypothetical protein
MACLVMLMRLVGMAGGSGKHRRLIQHDDDEISQVLEERASAASRATSSWPP